MPSIICAKCGRPIEGAAYFCRDCRCHFAYDHLQKSPFNNTLKCPLCGCEVVRVTKQ